MPTERCETQCLPPGRKTATAISGVVGVVRERGKKRAVMVA
jgi:hypothetical protein